MAFESNNASQWLNLLGRLPRELVPLFPADYNRLKQLAPIPVVRVLKTPAGEPRVLMIDRQKTIGLLKSMYAFHTKEEAEKALSEDDTLNIDTHQ